MIENFLYLALGFLLALFLGLMVAPLIWNRAVTLTERHLTKRVNPDDRAKRAEADHRFAALAMQNQRDATAKRELEQKNAALGIDLASLRNQNKALKAEIRELKQLAGKKSDNADTANSELKQQIVDLAAQMAAITAELEGDNSAIEKTLNAKDAKGKGKNSLADKINILREQIAKNTASKS